MRDRHFGVSLLAAPLALSMLLGIVGCDSAGDGSGKPAEVTTPEAKKTEEFVNKGDYKAIMAKNKGKMSGPAPTTTAPAEAPK